MASVIYDKNLLLLELLFSCRWSVIFFLAVFKVFSLSLVFKSLSLYLGMDFSWLYCLGLAQLFNLQVYALWQTWESFSLYFLEKFSASFWNPVIGMLALSLCSQRSLSFCSFSFHSSFCVFRLSNFYHSIFNFIDFVFNSIISFIFLLSTSSELFIGFFVCFMMETAH